MKHFINAIFSNQKIDATAFFSKINIQELGSANEEEDYGKPGKLLHFKNGSSTNSDDAMRLSNFRRLSLLTYPLPA